MKKIILASTSPTRKRMLTEAGLSFQIVPSEYEEDDTLPFSPEKLVMHLSEGKAEAVADKYKDAVVIGADTVIAYQGKILGKPHTPEKAKEMLKMLSGKQHSAFTGLTIIKGNKAISRAVETKVFFRDLPDKEIDDYIATGEPLDKAGAHAILENGGKFVERIEGSKTNVAGLPMEELAETLRDFGVQL